MFERDKGKKKSSIIVSTKESKNDDAVLMLETGLNKLKIDELKDQLRKIEMIKGNSPLNKYELLDILKNCGFKISDLFKKSIQKELEKRGKKKIDFQFIIESASIAKKLYEEEELEKENQELENSEYIDAFVALGGGPNTEGIVKKNHIINIIKNEFELTFDMGDFLEEIASSSDDLDYRAFCQLFETNGDDDARSVTSKRSFISCFSEKGKKRDSFHVKYKDFLKFCELEN